MTEYQRSDDKKSELHKRRQEKQKIRKRQLPARFIRLKLKEIPFQCLFYTRLHKKKAFVKESFGFKCQNIRSNRRKHVTLNAKLRNE